MRPGRTAVRSGRMNGAADAADAQNIEKTARRRIEPQRGEIAGAAGALPARAKAGEKCSAKKTQTIDIKGFS